MLANEHVTMQITRQVFDIETAENALIFLKMEILHVLLNVLILKTVLLNGLKNILLH
jgi:hypothetical protein